MTSLLAHAASVGKPLTDQLQTLVRRSRIVVIITAHEWFANTGSMR